MAKKSPARKASAKKSAASKSTARRPAARKGARKSAAPRSSQERELVNTGNDGRFVKRTSRGRFKVSDDVGRSQTGDRRRAATKTVKAGYGDQGDQRKKR